MRGGGSGGGRFKPLIFTDGKFWLFWEGIGWGANRAPRGVSRGAGGVQGRGGVFTLVGRA
jgi:hypothetical protein